MTEQVESVDLKLQETWQSTTGGTTWVSVKDPRHPDNWVQRKVGGKGTQRITVTVEERLFNEELVAYDSLHHCPFRNGLLVRILPKGVERSQFELNDEELVLLLQGGEDEEFQATIEKTDSEVILRRLMFLAERNATMWRYSALKDLIDARYAKGKTSQVYREIEADEARYAGTSF